MSLPLQAIAPDVCVAPQLDPAVMAEAAAAGFKSVINNRPDFEGGPEQPTSAQIEAAARAAGLQYAYLPVPSTGQTPEQIAQAARVLEQLPRPVLMFCRSGARSARLFQAATTAG